MNHFPANQKSTIFDHEAATPATMATTNPKTTVSSTDFLLSRHPVDSSANSRGYAGNCNPKDDAEGRPHLSPVLSIAALIALIILLIPPCQGQAVRFDWNVQTINQSSPMPHGMYPVLALPGTTVQICATWTTGTAACNSLATTYTSTSEASTCPSNAQLFNQLASSCSAAADNTGGWGIFIAPGNYAYVVTASYGTFGPYLFTAGGSGGGGSPGGANTQVQFNNSGTFGGSSGLTWNGSLLSAPQYAQPAASAGAALPWYASGFKTIPGLVASGSCVTSDPNAAANTTAINAALSIAGGHWLILPGIYAVNPQGGANVTITASGVKFYGSGDIGTPNGNGAPTELCNNATNKPAIQVTAPSGQLEPAPDIEWMAFANPNASGSSQPTILATGPGGGFGYSGDQMRLYHLVSANHAGFLLSSGQANGYMDDVFNDNNSTQATGSFGVDVGGSVPNSWHIGKVMLNCGNGSAGAIRFRGGSGQSVKELGDNANCPIAGMFGVAAQVTATSATNDGTNTFFTLTANNNFSTIGGQVGDFLQVEEIRNAPIPSGFLAGNALNCTVTSFSNTQIVCEVVGSVISGTPYGTTSEQAAWVADEGVSVGSSGTINIGDQENSSGSGLFTLGVCAPNSSCEFSYFDTLSQSPTGFHDNYWDSRFINMGGGMHVRSTTTQDPSLASGTVSNVSCSSGTCTVTATNSFTAGEWGYCSALASATWLNWSSGGPYFTITSASGTQFQFANSETYSASDSVGKCYVAYPIAHNLITQAQTTVPGAFMGDGRERNPSVLIWNPDKTFSTADGPGASVSNTSFISTANACGPDYLGALRKVFTGGAMHWYVCQVRAGGTNCDAATSTYCWWDALTPNVWPLVENLNDSTSGTQLSVTQSGVGTNAGLANFNCSDSSAVCFPVNLGQSNPSGYWVKMNGPSGANIMFAPGFSLFNTPIQIEPATAATSGANQNSPPLEQYCFAWNGSASANCIAEWRFIPGSGSNPSSYSYALTFNFGSGLSGSANIDLHAASFATMPPIVAGGTQSISGCSLTSAVGGAGAGSFHSGTAGTCTVTITPGITAPHGFRCSATDLTTTADVVQQTATTTTTCTIAGTTASADVITWDAVAF